MKELYCRSNHISSFYGAPSLVILDISFNLLDSFKYVPQSLKWLNISFNTSINELYDIPPKLEIFSCTSIGLKRFPDLPESLRELDCRGNYIAKFTVLPKKLKVLLCNNNPLISIKGISKIQILDIKWTLVSDLHDLPSTVQILDYRASNIINNPILKNVTIFNDPEINVDKFYNYLQRNNVHLISLITGTHHL